MDSESEPVTFGGRPMPTIVFEEGNPRPNSSSMKDEVRLVEDIDRCQGRIPRNLQVLLSSLDNPNINDCTVALLYTLMIESGFVPVSAPSVEENVQTCYGFDTKKLWKYSKMPDGWKKQCGKSYEISFQIAPFSDYNCRFLVLSMLDLMVIDLFIDKNLEFEESPYVSCFTVSPSNHVSISVSSEGENSVEFKNVLRLSRQFKNTMALPARATILNSCGVTNPSLLGLPEEVILKLLTYLKVTDIGNVSQTCKFLNGVSSDQHLWFNLVNRDLKMTESWNNDVDWYKMYKQKEIARLKMERFTRTDEDTLNFPAGSRLVENFLRPRPTSNQLPGFNPHPFGDNPFNYPFNPLEFGMNEELTFSGYRWIPLEF